MPNVYRELLALHVILQSMSGRGNCYDNAQAEKFLSRFKAELMQGRLFDSSELLFLRKAAYSRSI